VNAFSAETREDALTAGQVTQEDSPHPPVIRWRNTDRFQLLNFHWWNVTCVATNWQACQNKTKEPLDSFRPFMINYELKHSFTAKTKGNTPIHEIPRLLTNYFLWLFLLFLIADLMLKLHTCTWKRKKKQKKKTVCLMQMSQTGVYN